MILSTGSPLVAESYDYVYRDVKKDVCLASISGGTDIMAGFDASLGYSGWGAGQLEDEMARNGWLNVAADPGVIFDTPVEQRYGRAVSLLGFDPAMLSQEAGHA